MRHTPKKTLLWILPKWPLPAVDGQRLATMALLKHLSEYFTVDLLSFLNPEDVVDEAALREKTGIRNCFTLPAQKYFGLREFSLGIRALFRNEACPISLARFARESTQAQTAKWFQAIGPWDLLLFDTLHGSGVFFGEGEWVRPQVAKKIFYRAHNVESDLWRMTAERLGIPKVLYLAQERALRNYETRLVDLCDATFAVSAEDILCLRKNSPAAQLELLPIGMPFAKTTDHAPAEHDFLFIGRLDWPPNRQGLEWLLQKVWPEAQARMPGASLKIIGSGNGAWLEKYSRGPGVQALGRVDDLTPFYAAASAVVVPIFFGSGARVKAIEAASFAKRIISTELGVQGLGLQARESYLRAESALEWVDALCRIEDPTFKNMGRAAFAKLKGQFSEEDLAKRLAERIG